jgi:type I restriction enzyme S subunit
MKLVEPGTLLLSYKLSIGKVGIAQIPMYTNEAIAALTNLNSDVDSDFMYWALQHVDLLQGADRAAMGATLNKAKLSEIKFPVPPLKEQRRIAAILNKAAALRTKRSEAIAKLDQLLQSVLFDMFGDPVANPKEWPLKSLEALSDPKDRINYGVVQPGAEFPDGIPVVRVGDIEGGSLDQTSIKRIDPEIEASYSRSRLKGNELLVSCVGSIGTVALVPPSAIGFNIARAITRVPLANSESRPFIQQCLRTPALQRYFQEKARTVSQPTLNVGFVKSAMVFDPPVPLIRRYCDFVKQVEKMRDQQQVSMTSIEACFASLQQRAFQGAL